MSSHKFIRCLKSGLIFLFINSFILAHPSFAAEETHEITIKPVAGNYFEITISGEVKAEECCVSRVDYSLDHFAFAGEGSELAAGNKPELQVYAYFFREGATTSMCQYSEKFTVLMPFNVDARYYVWPPGGMNGLLRKSSHPFPPGVLTVLNPVNITCRM